MLSIPMMLEMCLESVFIVVDIYFVNKLGSHAVSVVGLAEAVVTIVYSVAIGLSAAATALVAWRVGEKNQEGASRAAAQSLILSGVLILVMSVAGYVYSEEILRLMGAEEEAGNAEIKCISSHTGHHSVCSSIGELNISCDYCSS